MDAFESLRKVNQELSEECQNLKIRLEEFHSNEDYSKLEQLNQELKQKLSNIAESQNEAYEIQIQDLNRQILALNEQLQEAQKRPLLFEKPEIAEPEVIQPEVKMPEIEVASAQEEVAPSNLLLGVSEPVEKGLSASSYFDTIGAKGDNSTSGTVSKIHHAPEIFKM